MNLDRRTRKIRRWLWDVKDDCGEILTVVIGLILALGAICFLWLAMIAVEGLLR